AVLEFKRNAGHFRSIPVERLIEAYPALRAAPVRRSEYLETRHIITAASQPLAPLSEFYPEVRISALHVQAVDLWRKGIQTQLIHFDLFIALFPTCDRVFVIKKTCLDDLVPVCLLRKPRFFCHRGRSIHAYGPCQVSLPFLLVPPIHE